MSFISFSFLILFSVVLLIRLTIGRHKTEPVYLGLLICASTIFYSWHVPFYLALILGSTLVDFLAARRIASRPPGVAGRRAALVISIAVNLGILGVFKYADFLLQPISKMLVTFGVSPALPTFDLILPLGISFYTFQSMSYTIDVYRGRQKPVDSFWQLFLFVSFFPQLVAGPIVRARDFLYQIARKRSVNFRVMSEGVFLVVRGFFLKMVCADNLAPYVDEIFASVHSEPNTSILLLGAVFFACQIFCDFAGYSSIARGSAYMLGFRLPVNFNNPHLAATFSEFWTRWHITLSQWLRDYLYLPLGGNRISPRRTYFNLLLVMLLGGLWHGAAWTYVTWGALHGAALAVERLLGLNTNYDNRNRALRFVWYLYVQIFVVLALVIFRSPSLPDGISYISNLFSVDYWAVPGKYWFPLAIGVLPVILMHLRGFFAERMPTLRVGAMEKSVLAALMLIATLTLYGQSSDFIYFQF